jgi:hypothetical protein
VIQALSFSNAVEDLLRGPPRSGIGMGRGYVAVGERVLALTPPGMLRMPNGVECELRVAQRELVRVGDGRLQTSEAVVVMDGAAPWDPVPRVRVCMWAPLRITPNPELLAGQGAGLTPGGDDILAGYAAGLVLWHGRRSEAEAIADVAAPRTTLLSATLLRHAARAELPEAAHALLERGDPAPLRRFGRSSGRLLMLGLALAC